MASGHITSWQIDGKTMQTVTDVFFLGSKITAVVTAAMKLKDTCFLGKKKGYNKPRQHIKKQIHYFVNKSPSSQGYGFSSSHIWM